MSTTRESDQITYIMAYILIGTMCAAISGVVYCLSWVVGLIGFNALQLSLACIPLSWLVVGIAMIETFEDRPKEGDRSFVAFVIWVVLSSVPAITIKAMSL